MFTNIDQAVEWIIAKKNTNYSFAHFKDVCNKLDNPQNDLRQIHVAGTNGKGSTVAYLMSLFMEYGYKVGTFVSPHYIKHQDRIRINNQYISDEDFVKILNKYYDFFVENELSMFEMDYIIMCEYFKQEKVDIAIIEAGLGGRLDSTNVVDNPLLSIITTIGFDHMDRLGDTLAKICAEKCGIIKNNSKVLIGDLNEECIGIVKDIANNKKAHFYKLDQYQELGPRSFKYQEETYEVCSYAKYQYHNASLALQAFKIVCDDLNIKTYYSLKYKAIKNSIWHCRFELVKTNPNVILDGGHNLPGINELVKSFDEFKGTKCIIFSALKRKEYKKMLEVLKKHTDDLIITSFDNNEVIDLNEFSDYKIKADYKKAIDEAILKYDNILICGSLYFMSEVVLNYKF